MQTTYGELHSKEKANRKLGKKNGHATTEEKLKMANKRMKR